MSEFVDVRMVDGLALPYLAGAEAALADADLDPIFDAAWQALLLAFPGLSLQPLFDAIPIDRLADMVDAVRTQGEEPPNPFLWFTLPCDEAIVDSLVPALETLPMVDVASRRMPLFPASTVSWGTNPDAIRTLQIQSAPNGVDAIYGWQVEGGTGEGVQLVDIESGWNLGHEELLTARIRSASVFGSADTNHGTAVAGILVGADNGVGTIGIVPDASLALVTENRGNAPNLAAAITLAAFAAGVGGVVLIELAQSFFAVNPGPDIVVEADRAVQAAIRLATLFGITVIEPAGNSRVNLDNLPLLAHTRPGSPTFVDSRAIVVGAAELAAPTLDHWARTFSSFGTRVDCFAAGSLIRAPSGAAADAYGNFGGTSGASAIIAGVAAAIQGMAVAATGAPLAPTDIRRLFRSPDLGTAIPDTAQGGVGTMPDLRKISRSQGWARVLPVGATAASGDSLVMAHLDADNRLVRRHWASLPGWGPPVPLPAPEDRVELTPCQPAVMSVQEQAPLLRQKHSALLVGPGGVHHIWWDSLGQTGDLTTPVAPLSTAAQGRSLAAVRAGHDRVVVAATSPEGRLVVFTGHPDGLSSGMSVPLVLGAGMYRRSGGPAIASRAPGLADVVVIEDGGSLNWFTGTTLATIGTGWSQGVNEPSQTSMEPGARPALLAVGDTLLAATVGSEGWLRVTIIDPVAGTIDVPVVVDVQVTMATSGPVALARSRTKVVVLGVDTEGVLWRATRPVTGGDWTELVAVDSDRAISGFGGVAAASMADLGVMALVVGRDGRILSSLSGDGSTWPPLQPVP